MPSLKHNSLTFFKETPHIMECTVTWTGHSGTRSGMGFVAETGSGHVLNMDGAPDGGGVAAYRLSPDGKATFLNGQDTKGKGATHVSVDQTGRYLFAANYGSGSVACLPLQADGSIGPASGFFQHEG